MSADIKNMRFSDLIREIDACQASIDLLYSLKKSFPDYLDGCEESKKELASIRRGVDQYLSNLTFELTTRLSDFNSTFDYMLKDKYFVEKLRSVLSGSGDTPVSGG